MPIDFGPQLIGETEKTLNAILRKVLAGRLTEPEWVTLRISGLLTEEIHSDDDLVSHVASRAHFADASALVAGLSDSGLLERGRTTEAGRALVAIMQKRIADLTGPIWDDLPSSDVRAAARVLNTVVSRAREVMQG